MCKTDKKILTSKLKTFHQGFKCSSYYISLERAAYPLQNSSVFRSENIPENQMQKIQSSEPKTKAPKVSK